MKISTLAIVAILTTPVSAALYAQAPGAVPSPGTIVGPGTVPTQNGNVDPSVTTTQAQNGTAAQQNAAQAQPGQPGVGGVIVPSIGPVIYVPGGQTVTTDIYGNQQITPGTSVQQNPQTPPGSAAVQQGNRASRSTRPGQAVSPENTDSLGNPIPTGGRVQNPLTRDGQPVSNGQVNPSQPPAAGTVTGR